MAMATTTTSNTETTKVKLKLMIDKRSNKVLFVEVEKDFVDILFNVLYMLLGSVARLVTDAGLGGCTGNLLKLVHDLYLWRESCTTVLFIHPRLLNASMQTNKALTTVFIPDEENVFRLKMI
ncbi:hypothetical protein WN944_018313 [Citrus x changshan-huyou]|uniref:Uncharacterized protein n=1 Tax=Citrus x changshan-huyou TaxID=2935761 RepID=A0AAP0LXV1_9ROSI